MNEEKRIATGGETALAMTELEDMTPEQLGGEIRLLTQQARRIVLGYAIEIGHRLKLAKEKVAHGEWMDWVERETSLSQSNVNRMMRLYEEYGKRQECMFGAELNSSALANLSVSNALALLAFPAEEREQAAVELDAEHASSRELAEAIAAKKAAEERVEALSRDMDELEDQVRAAEEKAARAQEREKKAAYNAGEEKRLLEEKLAAAEARTAEGVGPYEEKLAAAEKQIKELESRPIEVAVEKDEKAVEEAAEAARAKAEAEAAEKIAALQKKQEKAEKAVEKEKKRADEGIGPYKEKLAEAEGAAAAAKEELEAMRRKLAASDKDVTEFILHSQAALRELNGMLACLGEIGPKNPETARKLNAGLKALMERVAARCAEIEAGFAKREETTPHPSAAPTPSPQGEGTEGEAQG